MTPFEAVYTAFLSKMIDSSFIEVPSEVAMEDLLQLLKAAIFNFEYPKISLEIDELTETFVEELTADEIQLLSHLMTYEWFSRNLLNIGLFTAGMTTSEFKTFSKSNQLSSMKDTGSFLTEEIRRLKKLYHMKNGTKSGFAKLSN